MAKGKSDLSLTTIAVVAFGFAALRQPQSVLLVAGFALLAEKDTWLNRQAMQALLLTVAYYLAELVTGWIFGGPARFFAWAKLYGPYEAMNKINLFVGDALYLALIVFSVLAVWRVLHGSDAGLPFIAKLADGDFASALKKPPKPKPVPAYADQTYVPIPQSPVGSVDQPDLSASAQPQAIAGRHCASCGAALQEDSRFCTECGTKNN